MMFRVLVTRAPHQASELAGALRALGAEPVMVATIETVAPTSYAVLDDALGRLDTFDWVVFTSANAVRVFAERRSSGADGVRVAAIGPATARAVEAAGMRVDVVPGQAVAESLVEALLPHVRASRFLLVRAESARDILPGALTAAGAEVVIAPAYRTVVPEGSVEALRDLFARNPPEAVTFTSGSSVKNFFALVEAAGLRLPKGMVMGSIGPITSGTLRELGFEAQVEASTADVATLAAELVGYLRSR
jgi:uroporphyrinogen-III synthase